jgi:hypothetical protein
VSSTDALHGESTPPPSLQNFDYLQLVGEDHKDASSSSIENELGAEMDLLNSCLQTLEYLENKVKADSTSGSTGSTDTMTSVVSHSTQNHTSPTSSASSSTSQWAGMITASKAKAPRSAYSQAMTQTELALAELSQPLQPPSNKGGIGHTQHMANGSAPLGKQTSTPSMTPPSPAGPRGHRNGTLTSRSTSSFALTSPMPGYTPPIPPRSVVSLTDPTSRVQHSLSSSQLGPQATTTSRRQGYNRSISSGNMMVGTGQPPPQPVNTHAPPTTSTRGHPSLVRHHHHHLEAPGQSSTVFIHHIKDRRVGGLTHLV